MAKKKKKKQRQTSTYSAPISEYRKRKTSEKKSTSAKKTAKKQTTTSKNSRVLDTAPIRQRESSAYKADKPVSEYRKTTPKKSTSAKKTAQRQTSTSKNSRVQDIAPYRERQTSSYTTPRSDYNKRDKVANSTSALSRSKNSRVLDNPPDYDSFKKSGAFKDGYQFGDVTKTVASTVGDIGIGMTKGVGRMVEGLTDAGQYLVANGADALGKDDFANRLRVKAQENAIDRMFGDVHKRVKANSILSEKVDAINEGLGQVATVILTGGVAGALGAGTAGATAVTTGLMGASSFGSGMSEAYQGGATDEEATKYGLIKGTVDAGTELLFAGMGKTVKAVGLSKGISSLDDVFARKLSSKISNQTLKNLTEYGVKASAEGFEEVLAGIGSAVGKKLTYMDDEELNALIKDENLLEQFVVGSVVSGIAQSGYVPGMKQGSLREANKTGRDFITGYTQSEQAVIDKEVENRSKDKLNSKIEQQKKAKVNAEIKKAIEKMESTYGTLTEEQKTEIREDVKSQLNLSDEDYSGTKLKNKEVSKITEEVIRDLERGEIDTFTIEDTLFRDSALRMRELNKELETATPERKAEIEAELDAMNKDFNTELGKSQLLQESYRQKALADEKLDYKLSENASDKAKKIVQSALDAGENNTRKAHDRIDLAIKIAEDSDLEIEFVNDAQLEQLGHYEDVKDLRKKLREATTEEERNAIQHSIDEVRGSRTKTINGVKVSDRKILLNLNSKKALDVVLGHEVTHITEKAGNYKNLAKIVKEYAEGKGDYSNRIDSVSRIYKKHNPNITAEGIEQEVTADLVGEYVFTDEDFVRNLSAKEPGIFGKVRDYIKHVFKMATAGSSEARQLERAKRMFDKVYKEISNKSSVENNVDAEENVKYSLVSDKDTIDFLENQDYIVTYKSMQLIDGKLYPPMSAEDKGTDGKKKLRPSSQLGKWQQADENPSGIKKFAKGGYGTYTLHKGNGKSIDAAYNPYEHSSNLVLNDQFEEAYKRPNLVTVECHIPVSEMTSGYKAEYAKDATGMHDWKAGVVAKKLKGSPRKVYLTRWLKPVRVLDDSEVASKYKEVLGDEISVPFNVVSPSLLSELEKVGVAIDYKGSPMYQSIQKRKEAKKTKSDVKFSLSEDSDGKQLSKEQSEYFKDSKVRDDNGNLKVMYHGTEDAGFLRFDSKYSDDNSSLFFTDSLTIAKGYSGTNDTYAPMHFETIEELNDFVKNIDHFRYGDYGFDKQDGKYVLLDYDGDVIEESDTVDGIYEEYDQYYNEEYSSNYKTYLNLVNPLEVNADNNNWDEIPYNGGITTTRELSRIAKENGNDGVIIKNVLDYGLFASARERNLSTVAIAFDSNQIKSVNNQTPTSNPDIRYSLTENAEQIDNDYRKAVDSGDMETAQKMADEVAKKHGYVRHLFHGTGNGKFNVFRSNIRGIYTTTDENVAETYGKDVLHLYGKEGSNVLTIDAKGSSFWAIPSELIPLDFSPFPLLRGKSAYKTDDITLIAQRNGYDVVEIRNVYDTSTFSAPTDGDGLATDIIYFESNMLKSAEPVTYDDNGNVIPLSERFNSENNDIRYSLSEDSPTTEEIDNLANRRRLAEQVLSDTEMVSVSNGIVLMRNGEEVSIEDFKAIRIEAITEFEDANIAYESAVERMPSPNELAPVKPSDKKQAKPKQATQKQATKDIAPFKAEDVEDVDDTKPRKGERLSRADARKIENIKSYIKGSQVTRETGIKEYDEKIARKQAEYDGLKDKTTKKATNLYQQIQNIEAKKANWLESIDNKIKNYHKSIENIEARSRRDRRVSKNQEYRELFSDLIGDTSTWKDKKLGIYYQTNTLRRNLRDIVRDATGKRDIARADAIYEELQGKYNRHEAELNREANAVKQKYRDMKITKAEDTYIQMLGEFRHNPSTTITQEQVDKFYEKHKNKIDMDKVNEAIESARSLYDSLYERVNKALVEHGFKEIEYRKGYFPHFTETKQNLLQKIFNWKTTDETIPTDIAGLTEEFNPNRSWQSFDKRRYGDDTDFSFTKGLDNYLRGSLDWIYHIEDIQKRRALETEIRYRHSSEGLQKEIDAIRQNESLTNEEVDELIQNKLKEARNPLGNFLIDLRNGTNNLSGKKSTADRSVEYATNRQIYSTMTNITNRVTANAVVGSVSSALTNFIPITQSWGQVSPLSSVVAMGNTIKSNIKDDGMIDKSTFLTNRLRQNEALYKSAWDKIGDKAGVMMEIVDNFTSQTVWRSKYMENIQKGMSENEAIKDADQFAENVMAGRSRGNMPTIFNSKNPVTKMFTAFQLEVANQYGYMFKDMPQDMAEKHMGRLVVGYASMFVGAYAYNALTSTLTGRDSAFDPIGIIADFLKDLFGDDEEEPKAPLEAVKGLSRDVVEEIPFVGGLMGGGRIPISSAIPFDNPVSMVTGTVDGIAERDWKTLADEWSNPLYYLAMPMGGGQIRKTIQGLSMFSDEHPISGSYTNSGKLRYPVEDTFLNRLQAGIFGQYANENARDYFDNGRSPLKDKQIEEFIDLDIPIRDYWDYKEGLREQETLEDKFDYIADLDLPVSKKNILINNIVDREEEVDMSNYEDFSSYEEFDFASKNPEKWEFFQSNGISYEEYRASKENEDTARAYDWAYQNPEYYQVARAISDDLLVYWKHNGHMWNNIRADKDENGNSIPGTKKEKIIDYLNSVDDLEYEEKLVLFKKYYPKDDTYNEEIIDYLNNREDFSYDEMKTILEELEFEVDDEGNIYW